MNYHGKLCLDRCGECVCAEPLDHDGEHWCANDKCPTSWTYEFVGVVPAGVSVATNPKEEP